MDRVERIFEVYVVPFCFRRVTNFVLLTIGVVLLFSGVILLLTWGTEDTPEELKISLTSWRYNNWINSKTPKYFDVYLFNWTNPQEYIKNTSVTPHFVEIGPFVFKEQYSVFNLQWNVDTITFQQNRTWYFVPERSNASLSLNITNLNFPALAIAHMFRYEQDAKTRRVVDFMVEQKERFVAVPKSVKQLLYDGYLDNNVKNLNFLNSTHHVPFTQFGWFYDRNGSSTHDGTFEVYTENNVGTLKSWNGLRHTRFYKGECGAVEGGLSEVLSSFKPLKAINVFQRDICRSNPYYSEAETTIERLSAIKYTATAFDNGARDPFTDCFCNGECVPLGALNISSCRQGLPLFMSYPHFFNSHANYTSDVTGLSPDKEKHESYIILEKESGIPIEVRKTYQLNALLRPYEPELFRNLSRVFVPMVWYKEYWKADSEFLYNLRTLVTAGKTKSYSIASSIAGAVLVAVACFILIMKWIYRNGYSDADSKLLIPVYNN